MVSMESFAAVDWSRILGVVALGAAAWFGLRLLLRVVRSALLTRVRDAEDEKRITTVLRAIKYIASIVVLAMMVMLVLSNFGVSIAPLLGAAGVAGVAVGLAAQGIARDFIRGLSLLIDNQIRVGDTVEIAGKAGLVEEVTLRSVTLRDYEGTVHFIPMGDVHIVTNRSYGYSYALLDVGIGYDADIDLAMRAMRETAEALRAEPDFARLLLEPIEIAGVDRWADSSVVIRSRIKVPPGLAAAVRREMLRRLKQRFDAEGIAIPYPHMTLVTPRKGGEAGADEPAA
jgi:small conductance mechanosensitive channel